MQPHESVDPDAICVLPTTPITSPMRTRSPCSNTLQPQPPCLSTEFEEPAIRGTRPTQLSNGTLLSARRKIGHFGGIFDTSFGLCVRLLTRNRAHVEIFAACAMESQCSEIEASRRPGGASGVARDSALCSSQLLEYPRHHIDGRRILPARRFPRHITASVPSKTHSPHRCSLA